MSWTALLGYLALRSSAIYPLMTLLYNQWIASSPTFESSTYIRTYTRYVYEGVNTSQHCPLVAYQIPQESVQFHRSLGRLPHTPLCVVEVPWIVRNPC